MKNKFTANCILSDKHLYRSIKVANRIAGTTNDDFLVWFGTQYKDAKTKELEIFEAIELVHAYEKETIIGYMKKVVGDCEFPELVNVDGRAVLIHYDSYKKTLGSIRISRFSPDGPSSHDLFKSKDEALYHCGRNGYVDLQEGILDSYSNLDSWLRGLYICQWASEQVHPYTAIKESNDPEVKRLWKDFLEKQAA